MTVRHVGPSVAALINGMYLGFCSAFVRLRCHPAYQVPRIAASSSCELCRCQRHLHQQQHSEHQNSALRGIGKAHNGQTPFRTRCLYCVECSQYSTRLEWLTSVTECQNDRQTDRPGYSVRCGVIMRNCVGYGKATHSFHVRTINFATIKSLSVRSKHLTTYLV